MEPEFPNRCPSCYGAQPAAPSKCEDCQKFFCNYCLSYDLNYAKLLCLNCIRIRRAAAVCRLEEVTRHE